MVSSTLIDIATEEAHKSDHKFRHGCVIFNKKKIIATGRNYGARSLEKLDQRYKKHKFSAHAEIVTIMNARRDLNGLSMLVVRIDACGQLKMSKPCGYCMDFIHDKDINFRKIFYTTDEPEIEYLKV